MSSKIEIGDRVDVFDPNGKLICSNVRVVYMPGAPGDSWVFESESGSIVHVQVYGYIVRQQRSSW